MRRLRAPLVLLALAIPVAAAAQPIPPILPPTPTPASTASPGPESPRPPSPSTSPSPRPSAAPPVQLQTPSPAPPSTPEGSQPEATLPPAVTVVAPPVPALTAPAIARTPGRSTVKLVQTLERVAQAGLPVRDALIGGMGRFPVAGTAFWSDDWMAPRYTPFFHLHEGLDIFADMGTPIRSPDTGTVTRLTDGPIGGLAVWMTARNGTAYYFAHMQRYADGIGPGTRVDVGSVLGFVGDSGNADGGPAHLHFEAHRPGPVRPKPIVDRWLDEAQAAAPAWVDARIRDAAVERRLLHTEHSLAGVLAADSVQAGATPEYSLILSLLDPVAGAAGLVPGVPILTRSSPPSPALLAELVRGRVQGSLLPSLVAGAQPGRPGG